RWAGPAASTAAVPGTRWPRRTMVPTRAALMALRENRRLGEARACGWRRAPGDPAGDRTRWPAPRLAPSSDDRASPVRFLLGHGLEEEAVVLGLAAAAEAPARP